MHKRLIGLLHRLKNAVALWPKWLLVVAVLTIVLVISMVLKSSIDWNSKVINKSLQNLQIGNTLEGFKLTEKIYSEDYQAEVYLFEHAKNGGQVVYVAADDDYLGFDISFRTPAVDNTGVNHIIEHTVLQGSDKYPVKDLFTEMGKRSVSEEMNAFTEEGLTHYIYSTVNKKDYDNLFQIYMDSVYKPLAITDKTAFLQEGWHYEVNPHNQEISYSGIVLNEMKQAVLNSYVVMDRKVSETLYPDTQYHFEDGGEPEGIVSLSYQKLVDTYKQYYTPQNACIALYGNMDLGQKLKYINDNYYKDFEKTSPVTGKLHQEPLNQIQHHTYSYPTDDSKSIGLDDYMTWNMVAHTEDEEEKIGLEILNTVFVDHYLLPALDITGHDSWNEEIINFSKYRQHPLLNITLNGSENCTMEQFEKVIQDSLNKMIKEGVKGEVALAALDQYEFKYRDALNMSYRGNQIFSQIRYSFAQRKSPLYGLNQLKLVQSIRQKTSTMGYFSYLVNKHIKGNQHQAFLRFTPDATLMEAQGQQLSHKLETTVKAMTISQKSDLMDQSALFEASQMQTNDEKDLNGLPQLSAKDIAYTYDKSAVKVGQILSRPVLEHESYTGGIGQITLYFDVKSLTAAERLYLPLFQALFFGTDETDNLESFECYIQDVLDPNAIYPYMSVQERFMDDGATAAFDALKSNLIFTSIYSEDSIENAASYCVNSLQYKLISQFDYVPYYKLQGVLTAFGASGDPKLDEGYALISQLQDLSDDEFMEAVNQLRSIKEKILTQDKITISIVSEPSKMKSLKPLIEDLIDGLPAKSKVQTKGQSDWNVKDTTRKEALILNTPVQNIAAGFHVNAIGEKLSGADMVFAKILSEGYMYEAIRMKGGAYGGYFDVDVNGSFIFTTIRDPHLKETLETIRNISDYLDHTTFTQAEIDRAVIAVTSKMIYPKTIYEQADYDDALYFYPDYAQHSERLLKEIRATSTSDYDNFKRKMQKGLKVLNYVVAGPKDNLDQNKALFNEIIDPFDWE